MAQVKDDPINPKHYSDFNKLGMSALHITELYGLGFHLGSVMKYVLRAGKKKGESELNDLKKAAWYLNRHIHNIDPTWPNPMKDENK